MPHGVLVQVQSRAPNHDNFQFFRPQGDFLLPSAARSKGERGLRRGKDAPKNFAQVDFLIVGA